MNKKQILLTADGWPTKWLLGAAWLGLIAVGYLVFQLPASLTSADTIYTEQAAAAAETKTKKPEQDGLEFFGQEKKTESKSWFDTSWEMPSFSESFNRVTGYLKKYTVFGFLITNVDPKKVEDSFSELKAAGEQIKQRHRLDSVAPNSKGKSPNLD